MTERKHDSDNNKPEMNMYQIVRKDEWKVGVMSG